MDSEGARHAIRIAFLLLVVRSGQASETSKGWSDWLSEGPSLSHKGNYSAAAHAFREALAIAECSAINDSQLVLRSTKL